VSSDAAPTARIRCFRKRLTEETCGEFFMGEVERFGRGRFASRPRKKNFPKKDLICRSKIFRHETAYFASIPSARTRNAI
jgi:hypothetical protein